MIPNIMVAAVGSHHHVVDYGVPSVPKLVVIMLFINNMVHLYMRRLIYKWGGPYNIIMLNVTTHL